MVGWCEMESPIPGHLTPVIIPDVLFWEEEWKQEVYSPQFLIDP